MKTRGLILLVAILLPVTAQADLTLVQKIEGIGSLNDITTKLKGDKARVEVSPQLTMLIDNKSGEMLNLMNEQKKFIRISAEKAKAMAELANKYSGESTVPTTQPKLKTTGKKETINGYEAEEYIRESGEMKERYWVAPKYPDSMAILKQLQTIVPAAWANIAKGLFDYRDFPGLPLRTIVKTERGEITSTIVSVKQDPLSDTEFSVPKDFEELKVPNIRDILPSKPAAPSSTEP